MVLTPWLQDHIAGINASSTKVHWVMDHLQAGFHGTRFKWDDADPPAVMDYKDVLRAWGYTRWVTFQGGEGK